MNEYRITEHTYYDKNGIAQEPYYKVQKFTFVFFGLFRKWKNMTYRDCSWGDCYNQDYSFKTQERAQKFIDDIICKDIPRQDTISKVLNECGCE